MSCAYIVVVVFLQLQYEYVLYVRMYKRHLVARASGYSAATNHRHMAVIWQTKRALTLHYAFSAATIAYVASTTVRTYM